MYECDVLPDFYHWTEPVARKEHRCCECGAPINRGEKYFRAHGKWDGAISVYRQHLLCMEACMYVRDNFNGHECIPFGCLREYCHELFADQYHRPRDRHNDKWKTMRSMMARIIVRERHSR